MDINYNSKCKVCFTKVDEQAIVDIDKSGNYIYYCGEICYNERHSHKGNKYARAERQSRRNQKHNYDFGDE